MTLTTPKEFLAEFRRARSIFPEVPIPPMRVRFLMGKRRRLLAQAHSNGQIDIVWNTYTLLNLAGRQALLRHEIAHIICGAMEKDLQLEPLDQSSRATRHGHCQRWQRIAKALGGHCARFFDPDEYTYESAEGFLDGSVHVDPVLNKFVEMYG